jgi:DNA-binding Xre family transcriptional regulator
MMKNRTKRIQFIAEKVLANIKELCRRLEKGPGSLLFIFIILELELSSILSYLMTLGVTTGRNVTVTVKHFLFFCIYLSCTE